MNEETYDKLADILEKSIDAYVEYETEHDDAGSNYSHMPREGGWDYYNGEERLKEWLESNGWTTPKDMEPLINEVLDWCDIKPGHIFSGGTTSAEFVVDSYPVGEVEDQYCFDDLARLLETSESETKEFVALAINDNRFCLRPNGDGGILSYTNTDAVWIMSIDRQWVDDKAEDYELVKEGVAV